MNYFYQELSSVDVVESKPENALDIDAVNIIDYFPFESSILTLKKHRNAYYVGIDSIGVEGPKYRFDIDRPKRLFIDCLGSTRWTERYALFSNLTYPVNVRSFQIGDKVAIVNYEIDSISVYNAQRYKQTQLPFAVASDIKEVWQDLSNDNLYFYTRKNGNHLIYHLDEKTGEQLS
jgi:hypothetical protein